MEKNCTKQVSFNVALLFLIAIITVMVVGLAILQLPTLTVFVITLVVLTVLALLNGYKMEEIQEHIVNGCKKSATIILILMSAGMIVGSWIISGTVPSIMYYGLKILTPSYFLVLGFLLCCIVAFFTGSSYTAIGTLGVAFMGIGLGMGINPAITAGMVVSGAVFGDKMSPFSDTTILAAAVSETDIFLHIRSMLYTTGPALLISAVLYYIIGLRVNAGNVSMENIDTITTGLSEYFRVSPFLLIIPILTIVLAVKKVPTLISLTIGALMGVVAALIFQPSFGIKVILNSLTSGVNFDFGDPVISKLLNRGGISSMMSTVSLTVLAMAFGEILQQIGVLDVLLDKIKRLIDSPKKIVLTTLSTCLLTVCLTASQYLSVLLPGEIYKERYKKLKMAPYVLSRTLEDGGTVLAFIVPWSMCALYASGVLGVSPYEYVPYAFLPMLCPLIAIFLAVTGIGIFKDGGEKFNTRLTSSK